MSCAGKDTPRTSVPPLDFSSHHLVITTKSRVLCYDASGLSSIFTCRSGGIIAAKEADNGTLAIADSQVVILHKVGKDMERSYRLRGEEVCMQKAASPYEDLQYRLSLCQCLLEPT